MPAPSIGPSALAAIIAEMRNGATVQTGGSRAHSSLGLDADGWYWEHFDEGQVDRQPASEADLHRLAKSTPQHLLPILRRPHWREFVRALAADQPAAAQAALKAFARWGDPLQHAALWSAILGWPREPLSAQLRQCLRDRIVDHTLWHLFMEAHGWARDSATRVKALAFLDRTLEMIDEVPEGEARLRRSFAQLGC